MSNINRAERVRLKKIQQREERLTKMRDDELQEINNLKERLNIKKIEEDVECPEYIKNGLKSNNRKVYKKAFDAHRKYLLTKRNKLIAKRKERLAINQGKRQILEELLKEAEKEPAIEDVLDAAKILIKEQRHTFTNVKPVSTFLKEQGFIVENIDIAKVLLLSGQFRRGIFSKIWKYGKPSKIEAFIVYNCILFRNTVKYALEKYLPKIYKFFN